MREIFNLNEKWAFSKEAIKPPVAMPCVQRSWTTLAGVSPVTVIASEPCS